MMAGEKEKEKDGCWEGMAEELVVEILSRLPVRSLLRLKATCKSWQSLIESRFFAEFHAGLQNRDRDRLFLSQGQGSYVYSCRPQIQSESDATNLIEEFDLGAQLCKVDNPLNGSGDDDPKFYDLKILGPLHNGIYCLILPCHLRPSPPFDRISFARSRFALTNLATREQNYTNPFPADIDIPPEANFTFGFGCTRNESGTVADYKLVLNFIIADSDFLSFVYSLRRGSWEKIAHVRHGAHYTASDPNHKAVSKLVNEHGEVQTPLCINHSFEGCPQSFFNGSWHWLDRLPPTASDEYSDRVLSFDLLTEEFGSIAGPPHDYLVTSDNAVIGGLPLLSDRLAAIYMSCGLDSKGAWLSLGLDVWIMMEYGVAESWTKIYSCATPFHTFFYAVVGFCYSAGSSCIQIHRIFLEDGNTCQLVSIDGPGHIKEHNIYLKGRDFYLNTLGVSSYVETLDSLTFPRNQDPNS